MRVSVMTMEKLKNSLIIRISQNRAKSEKMTKFTWKKMPVTATALEIQYLCLSLPVCGRDKNTGFMASSIV